MEAVSFKMAPFSNKFYGALERQVRDQIQHKHFCGHVTRLHHIHHQKRYIGMDDREQELYFD